MPNPSPPRFSDSTLHMIDVLFLQVIGDMFPLLYGVRIDSARGKGYLTLSKNLRVAVVRKTGRMGRSTGWTGTRLLTEGGYSNMAESSYSVIEKKISDLAEMVIALKKEKASLAAQLEEKEAEVKDLTRRFAELTKERNSIRDKVETILARIESIEL